MARFRPSRDADDVPTVPLTGEGLREAARLFAYVRPYRVRFAAALAALFLSSLLGLAFPYLTGRLVDAAQRDLGGAPPPADRPTPSASTPSPGCWPPSSPARRSSRSSSRSGSPRSASGAWPTCATTPTPGSSACRWRSSASGGSAS